MTKIIHKECLQVVFGRFTTSPYSEYKTINSMIFKNRLILIYFKTVFRRNQHLVEKYSVSCVHMTKETMGNTRVWFKVYCCFTIMFLLWLVKPRHFLLKCLCQAMKISSHVLGYRFCIFI